MKTPNWKPVKIETIGGLDIVLSFEHEDINARDHFINDCGWSLEQYVEIENYFWFCAKFSVFMGDIELSCEYLGGNCYENKSEVMGNNKNNILSGYYSQMRDQALEEALTKIPKNWKIQG